MKNKKETRKIYIILTYTGTVLSKIIKYYTKAEFSHISIALDENLDRMYSFGRLNPYNPFIGGFVVEGINIGTFKRFKNTKAAVYSIEITNNEYKKIKSAIKKIKRKQSIYKFNVIGLFASGFNIKVKKDNSFYCAEFIKYLLDEAKVKFGLPDIIKPNDFKYVSGLNLKYKGILRKYKLDGVC